MSLQNTMSKLDTGSLQPAPTDSAQTTHTPHSASGAFALAALGIYLALTGKKTTHRRTAHAPIQKDAGSRAQERIILHPPHSGQTTPEEREALLQPLAP